jgi:predicted nucleotidyltransferase
MYELKVVTAAGLYCDYGGCTMDTLNVSPTHKYVINHVLAKFMGNPNIDKVFLFGSCAKGTASDGSDIDMFVVTTDKIADDNHEAFELLYGATDDIPLDRYISCEILTATRNDFQRDRTLLIRTVKKEGIELNGLL